MAFTVQWILDNFVYLGGIKNTSNPKTKQFWSWEKNGSIVLDTDVQLRALNAMYVAVQEAKKADKEIVVVCLKSWLAEVVTSLSEKYKFHYFAHKLPAWFLTNFDTLFSTIKNMNERRQFITSESFSKLTKKEQTMTKRHLAKIEKIYGGVKELTKKPDLVIVIDGTMLDGLVHEIKLTKIPNILLASTDFSQWWQGDTMAVVNLQNQKSPQYILETLFA